jgi:hypothetical protein
MESDGKKINLESIPKKEVFNAPAGYFESLSTRIDSRIDVQSGDRKVRQFYSWRQIGYTVAASLSIFALVWFGTIRFETGTPEQILAGVPSSDLQAYLENEDLEVSDIIEHSGFELIDDCETKITLPEVDDSALDILYEQYDITPEDTL